MAYHKPAFPTRGGLRVAGHTAPAGQFWIGLGVSSGMSRRTITKYGRDSTDIYKAMKRANELHEDRREYTAVISRRTGRVVWDSDLGHIR